MGDEQAGVDRRQVLATGAVAGLAGLVPAIGACAAPQAGGGAGAERLIAGTYASGGGKGLYPLDRTSAGWQVGTAATGAQNVSFGVRSGTHNLHYLLDEQTAGRLLVGRVGADGGWTELWQGTSGGADPCHIALGADGRLLAIANYSSGTVAVYRLDPATGLPTGEPVIRANRGTGPNKDRQEGPHAHWVGFGPDGTLYSVDLGTDAVLAYPVDAQAGTIGPIEVAFRARPGAGPRHLAFHPRLDRAYLVHELDNSVVVLEPGGARRLRALASISALPPGFSGESYVAHVAVNAAGDRLYVSNRGHNSVAVFSIDGTGMITPLQHAPSGGDWPRFFRLSEDGRSMLVAHQRSGTVVEHALGSDGRLGAETGRVAVPAVVFVGPR